MTDPTPAAAGTTTKKGSTMNPTVRMIGTILTMISKFGPGIVAELGSLFAIFQPAASASATTTAAPAAVLPFAAALADKAGSGSVSVGDVKALADQHSVPLSEADAHEVHKLAA